MSQQNTDQIVQATLEKLSPLIGEWIGEGRAVYPTIEMSHYRERLTFEKREGKIDYLIYEQATDLFDEGGQFIRKSHWEAGLVRPLPDGTVELACVQAGGRLEVLHGEFVESDPGSVTLRFDSKHIANDERMKSSSRQWTVDGSNFNYVQEMATTKVNAPTVHLEASLERI
jgi:hypothetical protein